MKCIESTLSLLNLKNVYTEGFENANDEQSTLFRAKYDQNSNGMNVPDSSKNQPSEMGQFLQSLLEESPECRWKEEKCRQ